MMTHSEKLIDDMDKAADNASGLSYTVALHRLAKESARNHDETCSTFTALCSDPIALSNSLFSKQLTVAELQHILLRASELAGNMSELAPGMLLQVVEEIGKASAPDAVKYAPHDVDVFAIRELAAC